MRECGFKFETQESRKYEYGRGKEFETREEALEFARKIENQVKSQIALARCWELYEYSEIVEEESYVKVRVKLKTLLINF